MFMVFFKNSKFEALNFFQALFNSEIECLKKNVKLRNLDYQ